MPPMPTGSSALCILKPTLPAVTTPPATIIPAATRTTPRLTCDLCFAMFMAFRRLEMARDEGNGPVRVTKQQGLADDQVQQAGVSSSALHQVVRSGRSVHTQDRRAGEAALP